ncbi:Uncharacterised protein [Mycobacterium tuberculosis]|nr:Uncharacterised protein [Mycobacterium tuberculosis]
MTVPHTARVMMAVILDAQANPSSWYPPSSQSAMAAIPPAKRDARVVRA